MTSYLVKLNGNMVMTGRTTLHGICVKGDTKDEARESLRKLIEDMDLEKCAEPNEAQEAMKNGCEGVPNG